VFDAIGLTRVLVSRFFPAFFCSPKLLLDQVEVWFFLAALFFFLPPILSHARPRSLGYEQRWPLSRFLRRAFSLFFHARYVFPPPPFLFFSGPWRISPRFSVPPAYESFGGPARATVLWTVSFFFSFTPFQDPNIRLGSFALRRLR